MTKVRVLALSVAVAIGLLGVGVWAQGGEQQSFRRSFKIGPHGQVIAGEPRSVASPPQVQTQAQNQIGAVISGDELGFRLGSVSPRGGTVTGTLVVKVGDEWFEVTSPMVLRPAVR